MLLAPFATLIVLFGMLLMAVLVHNLFWSDDDASDQDGLPEEPDDLNILP
jgi:hypothetical protein